MSRFYNRGAFDLTGDLRWESASNIGMLVTTLAYVPDRSHTFVSDVSAELSGGNYGRVTSITGRTRTLDNSNDRVVFDADNPILIGLQAAAGIPQYAVFYDNATGADSTRPLIGWVTLSGSQLDRTPDGSDYRITWNSGGLWVISTL